jgi:DNA topoisomerase-1
LRHVHDDRPGIRREPVKDGFRYLDAHGEPVEDEATLARIRRLVIPPAWTEVWICPEANGHLQANGRDARGRKRYRYLAKWREARDEVKL